MPSLRLPVRALTTLSALLLTMGAAHAELVKYNFTATGHVALKLGVGGTAPDSPIGVLHNGDAVNGSFYYDTATPGVLDLSVPDGPAANYRPAPGAAGASFSVAQAGYDYTGATPTYALVQDFHAGAAYPDFLQFGAQNNHDHVTATMELLFKSVDNGEFTGTGLPTELTLSHFATHKMNYYWIDLATGSTMLYTADLTSLARDTSPVPEPGAYAMLLLGLGALGMTTRRKDGGTA